MATNEIGIKIGLQGAQQVNAGLKQVEGRLGGLESAALSAGGALAGLLSGAALAAYVRSAVDAVDALNDVADATGSTVEEISKLERVARINGGTIDTVSTALVKFNKALADADGKDGASLALKAIGLEAQNLRQLDPAAALRQTAAALSGFSDDGNKARIVQELFGKSLKEVAPFLKDLAEAGELSATVTAKQTAEAEAFNRQLFTLAANSQDAARQIAGQLIPTLSEVLKAFNDARDGGAGLSAVSAALGVALEAVTIFGANVAFVFGAVGREIGAIAAQSAALARLDFSGFAAISDAVKADGVKARQELDALEQRILSARKVAQGYVVDGLGLPPASAGAALPDIARLKATATAAEESQKIFDQINGGLTKRAELLRMEAELGRPLLEGEKLRVEINESIVKAGDKLLPNDRQRLTIAAQALAVDLDREAIRKRQVAADKEYFSQQQQIEAEITADTVRMADAYKARVFAQFELEQSQRNQAELTKLEGELLFASAETRARAIEQLKAMQAIDAKRLELARDLNLTEEQRAEILAKYSASVQAGVADGVQRAVNDDLRKTFDQVSQSLADALLNGGKSAGESLKRYFKTLILQPIIRSVVDPLAGALVSSLGLAGSANASTGGSSGLAGTLSSASSLSSFANLLNGGISESITNGFARLASSDIGAKLGLSTPTADTLGTIYNAPTAGASSFGSALGTAGSIAGGALAGYAANKLISGGYRVNGTVDFIGNVATVAASAIFGPLGGAIAGAVAGGINRLFGTKLKDVGIEGKFGPDGFSGNQYQFIKGGVFRDDKTKRSALDGGTAKALSEQFNAIKAQTALYADALGVQADVISGYTKSIKISTKGLTEEQIGQKFAQEFAAIGEALSELALGGRALVRDGETAAQALQRLSSSLTTVNAALDALGLEEYARSLAGGDLASQLADVFGGLDKLTAATGSYYDAYFSESEKAAKQTEQITEALGKLGLSLPGSRAEFRALVEAQDLTTAAGRDTFAALINLSDAFAGITQSATDAAEAQRTLAEMYATSNDDYLGRLALTQSGGSLAVPNGIAVPMAAATTNGDTASETRALRQDLRDSQAQVAALLSRINKIFQGWEVDGLPATRSV